MSSLRNAINRRPHKERSQPESRERKWGILEKHKDYSLRAADYNNKKKKLSQLSQKAREKNPDEFAFGMVRGGHAGLGRHKGEDLERVGRPLSHDAVKLLKTQDAGYLKTVAAKGRREIERLSEEVGLDGVTVGDVKMGKKTMFEDEVESEVTRGKKRKSNGEMKHDEGAENIKPAPIETQPEVPTTTPTPENEPSKPRSRKVLQAEQDALTRLKAERKRRKRLQDMRVAKLEALKKRQREILAAADQLDLQRAKMARTVGGVNKDGVRFKIRERKR